MKSVANESQRTSWIPFRSKGLVKRIQELEQSLAEATDKIHAIERSNATIEFNMDGTVLEANDNFLKTLGYSREEVVGNHHRIFVDADYAQSAEYRDFWKGLGEGKFYSERFRRISKSGDEVFIQATYNPIIGADGRPYKVVKCAIDVTEDVRMQQEAFRLKDMVENLPTNLIFADTDLVIRYMNPSSLKALRAIAHLLPVPPDQVIGNSIDIFHKNPEHQRRILADPANYPVKSTMQLGDEILALEVNSITNKDDVHIGVMTTWSVITEQSRIRSQVGSLGTVGKTVASNVQDMSAAITEISENIGRTANLALTAEDQSRKAGETINTLGECSGEIDDVVTLIRDLAEQTNLLALNATIEAARAGEAGRGFAVVATEVKALATGTQSATQSIADRVQRIRTSIEEVVKSTNEIAKSILEVSGNTTEVAAAIEQQSAIINTMGTTADELVELSSELQKL